MNSIQIQAATNRFLSRGKSITVLPPQPEPASMDAGFHHPDEVLDLLEGVDTIFDEVTEEVA